MTGMTGMPRRVSLRMYAWICRMVFMYCPEE